MKRFHRLELDQAEQQLHPQPGQASLPRQRQEGDRDEHHWMQLADQHRRNGLYEEALRHYSRALEMERSLVAAWVGQVQMLILLEEYPEAELWSRKALEIFKSNGDLLAGRAQALCRRGDMSQAQPVCDQALGQQGESAYRWMVRGDLMLARRDSIEAYCFDKAVQIDGDWLVLLEIALIYLHYELATKALLRVRQAVERAPDQARCWFQQGMCEVELGLAPAARKSFARCLEIAPNHVEARRQLTALDNGGSWMSRWWRRAFRS